MYPHRHIRRQVDALRSRLKPILAILRLRNLAMEFCDEFDEAASSEGRNRRESLLGMSRMFMPHVGQAGFRLDTFNDLARYFARCIDNDFCPEPREIVFTLLPWAGRGPRLRPDLWERPAAA